MRDRSSLMAAAALMMAASTGIGHIDTRPAPYRQLIVRKPPRIRRNPAGSKLVRKAAKGKIGLR